MIAMPIAMAVSWKKHGKIPPMMIVTSLTVLFFGGLTIYFKDPTFIKVKATLINLAFALILYIGALKGRYFLKNGPRPFVGSDRNRLAPAMHAFCWLVFGPRFDQ